MVQLSSLDESYKVFIEICRQQLENYTAIKLEEMLFLNKKWWNFPLEIGKCKIIVYIFPEDLKCILS